MCFAWIWEQTAIISLCNINLPLFKTEAESVYCAVRNGSLNQTDTVSYFEPSTLTVVYNRPRLFLTMFYTSYNSTLHYSYKRFPEAISRASLRWSVQQKLFLHQTCFLGFILPLLIFIQCYIYWIKISFHIFPYTDPLQPVQYKIYGAALSSAWVFTMQETVNTLNAPLRPTVICSREQRIIAWEQLVRAVEQVSSNSPNTLSVGHVRGRV